MPATSAPDLRERIYQAAISQFRQFGFSGTAISKVTHEAGVAKGTFFNYFPTKDHVLAESLHRTLIEAFGAIEAESLSGTSAILGFAERLATSLSQDPVVARALVLRFSELPGAPEAEAHGAVRDEERVRTWIEARLGETLPRSVPLVGADREFLGFLLTWTLRGTLEEWVREGSEEDALRDALRTRIRYLLESSGLPADA